MKSCDGFDFKRANLGLQIVGPAHGGRRWRRRTRAGCGARGLLLAGELLGRVGVFKEARVGAVRVCPELDQGRRLLLDVGVLSLVGYGELENSREDLLHDMQLELQSVALHALVQEVHGNARYNRASIFNTSFEKFDCLCN